MQAQDTPVILVVGEHWLLGRVATHGKRVQDVLIDPNSDYLQTHDVRVFHKVHRETCIASLPEAVVPKEKLSLVLIPTHVHEAPERRSFSLVEKNVVDVFLVVPGYTVQGKLHLTGRADNSFRTLSRDVGDFFPITQATVSGAGDEPFESSVVITNKAFVTFFYAGGSSSVRFQKSAENPNAICRGN